MMAVRVEEKVAAAADKIKDLVGLMEENDKIKDELEEEN